MTLQQLQYLVALAESNSINQAAQNLFVSQSGISKAIKQLESELGSVNVLSSKKGKLTIKEKKKKKEGNLCDKPIRMEALSHNRKKRYILEEGKPVEFLIDLGVMTSEGKIVHSRYDKFRQINRFLEFIEDILPKLT